MDLIYKTPQRKDANKNPLSNEKQSQAKTNNPHALILEKKTSSDIPFDN